MNTPTPPTAPLALTALVTGGSRGIGEAVARRLAADGFSVVLTYVSKPEEAAAVAESIVAQGGQAKALRLDVSDRASIAAFFKEHIEGQVELEVLVNNAGITKDGLLVRMKDEDWDAVLNVNLGSAFRLTRAALKGMMSRRWGRIINITSIVGVTGNAGQANYAASKAGLIGMTKSLAQEMAPRNVTANCVAPGFIVTPMTDVLTEDQKQKMLANIPVGYLGDPKDIAASVAFLASEEARYITGQTLHVNGGMAMV